MLRKGLTEAADYNLVPTAVWEHLLGAYGGAPAIDRKVVLTVTLPPADPPPPPRLFFSAAAYLPAHCADGRGEGLLPWSHTLCLRRLQDGLKVELYPLFATIVPTNLEGLMQTDDAKTCRFSRYALQGAVVTEV